MCHKKQAEALKGTAYACVADLKYDARAGRFQV